MQTIEIELEDDLYERILSKEIDVQAKFEEFLFELNEHTQIFNVVQNRKDTPLSEYVSSEDMVKKLNIDLEGIEEVK